MNILATLIGVIFVLVGGMTVAISPDILAKIIVGIMTMLVILGYVINILPLLLYASGFRRGRQSIEDAKRIQADSPWLVAQNNEHFFNQRTLDSLYATFLHKAEQQAKDGLTPGNIEEIINDDSLAIRTWQTLIHQIPGTLTAMGLLGTFIGLITGISNIGFSSVEAALGSIEVLLGGIETAFYTSVVGVIFSIMFNMLSKVAWNITTREMGFFFEQFHMFILPSTEEQHHVQYNRDIKCILERLEVIPVKEGKDDSGIIKGNVEEPDRAELQLMTDIREGLKNGEFTFYLQPRYDLVNNTITGSEALLRWNRPGLGIVPLSTYVNIVENNGFIVRLDTYIWENVFKTIRRWIDTGLRPSPVSVNLSKTDIMAMDVAFFFSSMAHKYRIPPRSIDIEIAQNAYLECEAAVRDAETQLRQAGFRVIIDNFDGNSFALNLLTLCHADAVKMDLRSKSIEQISELYEQTEKMNCPIIVESIENSKQLAAIRTCGAKEGQGFFFDRPMPIEEFEEKMKQE